jgi:hypothetical protein
MELSISRDRRFSSREQARRATWYGQSLAPSTVTKRIKALSDSRAVLFGASPEFEDSKLGMPPEWSCPDSGFPTVKHPDPREAGDLAAGGPVARLWP